MTRPLSECLLTSTFPIYVFSGSGGTEAGTSSRRERRRSRRRSLCDAVSGATAEARHGSPQTHQGAGAKGAGLVMSSRDILTYKNLSITTKHNYCIRPNRRPGRLCKFVLYH